MSSGIENWTARVAPPNRGALEVLYYLDTMIVIYAVEGNPADQLRAQNHLAVLEQAGHQFAISEFTHTPSVWFRLSAQATDSDCLTSSDSFMARICGRCL